MDIAAGVVAFVTIAAQSAKLIHEAAAAYGGGPQDIKQLLDAIASICAVLQQLSTLLTPPELVLPADLVSNLKSSLKEAERQMNAYRITLSRCLPAPDDTTLRRMMIRFWPLLHQQDLEKMRQGLLLHLSVLTVHTEMVNGIRTADIGQQVTTLDRNGQQILALQRQYAESAATFQTSTGIVLDASNVTLQAIDAGLNEIPGLLNRHFDNLRRHTTSPKFRGLEDSLLHLHHKLDQLPRSFIEFSPSDIVGSIMSTQSLAGAPSFTVEVPVASLHSLVKQLYMLQGKGRKALSAEQSEQFLQALRTLLGSAKDAESSGLNVDTILSMIDVARHVKMQRQNGVITLAESSRLADSVITGRIDSPLGPLAFWSRLSRSIEGREQLDANTQADTTHTDIVIWLTIGSSPDAYQVCVSFAKHSSGIGVTFPHPFLRASRVLHDSSVALEAIRKGDLKSLREAFITNKARPTDCDVAGRGLINIACFHGHANIARFLISQGADIHSLERRVDDLWDCEACHLSSSSLWDNQGFLCAPWRPGVQNASASDLLALAHRIFGKSTIPPHPAEKEPRQLRGLRKLLKAGDMDVRVVPSHHDIKPVNILVVGKLGVYPQIGNFGPNINVPLGVIENAIQGAPLW